MFGCGKKRDNPLHLAVIKGDFPKAQQYVKNPEFVLEQGSLGFTPLELAQYLGRVKIEALFEKTKQKQVHIRLPDTSKVKSMTEEVFETSFEISYFEHLYFSSYQELKTTIKNCPYLYKSKCFDSDAQEIGRLYSCEIASGYTANLTIGWIDNTIGYGVFANEPLKKGAFVGEYTGEVRALSRFLPDSNAFCFHYPTKLWSFNYRVIDALKGGNVMRFVNHSELPNLTPHSIIDRGLVHIAFFANRDIASEEQLTFDYGKDYWKKRAKA